mmetsp:Transcript_2103/g.6270  ORF Transcript_2103/g.6270 Transcript_2103/m.6270 type:complete len:441 (+) Transcript_2103:233-1555(+)
MASQIYTSPAYLLPRTALWIALFVFALLDGLRHRYENARARKLYAGVVLVLAALVTQDVLLLLWSILGVKVIFTVYIFFTDAADSMFMALMLVIAAGFCITREDLGPYKNKIITIPSVYVVTVLIIDYTMYQFQGVSAFNVVDMGSGGGASITSDISEFQRTLLVVCAFVNLFVLILAIVYVFDTVAKERQMLEEPEQDVYGDAESGVRVPPSMPQAPGSTDAGTGHAVVPPMEAQDNGGAMPNTYGEVTVEDLDGPKTVEEKVARQAKIRVFKQFSAGVVAYVTTTLAVIILPIFVSPDAGTSETAVKVVLVLQNLVFLIFMASLAWIFRLRGDSPYLVVGEEEGEGQGDDNNMTTELGVLGDDDSDAPGRHRGSDAGSMDNFALHDDLDDDEEQSRAEAGRAVPPPATVAAPLPEPDLKAEAPKAELLMGVPKSDTVE